MEDLRLFEEFIKALRSKYDAKVITLSSVEKRQQCTQMISDCYTTLTMLELFKSVKKKNENKTDKENV